MNHPAASPPSFLRTWLIWTAALLVFPPAGLAGTAVAGRIDSPLSALTGGAIVGLIIGTAQAALSRRRLDPRRWIPATTVGMGLGLLLGAAAVGYRTSLAALMLMGAITGLLLGAAQTAALPRRTRSRWLWAAAMPVTARAPIATKPSNADNFKPNLRIILNASRSGAPT